MRKKSKYKRKRIVKSNDINYFLRNLPEMKDWRAKCLLAYAGKCAITHNFRKGKIHIHHVKAHHTIRDEVLAELNIAFSVELKAYNEEEKLLMAALYVKKHEDIIGIPMLKRVHKLFHKLYGYSASMKDFKEFQTRWNAGEFT